MARPEGRSSRRPDGVEGPRPAARRDLLMILALALFARAVLFPWALDLQVAGDEIYYWDYYLTLAEGDVDHAVLRPPLWGWIVSAVRWLSGDPSIARVLTALLGAATAPLLYALAALVFDRRTALAAGVVCALYPEYLGFSHYLWAETFFTLLAVLSVHWFFRFFADDGRTGFLIAGSLVAGLAFLAKAFAAVVFAALILTLLLGGTSRKPSRVALAAALFLLPPALYSLGASAASGRFVFLSETGVLSARQAAGLDPPGRTLYDPEKQREKREELVAALSRRSPADWLSAGRRQFYNLWSPSSFVSTRLLETRRRWWRYPIDDAGAERLAVAVTIGYLALVLAGLAGLCLSDWTRFKTFSVVCLLGLSATALLLFLTSRYRLTFCFLFMVYAGHLFAHPRLLFERLREPRRAVPLLALVALFAHIVLVKKDAIGLWG